ncbi:hypothetical protein BC828DRAFT_374342 [Blastocladiella britannica]|nr:hypothetical protein BC828DRAFT_374342 [Blastocladiella britannica]
MPTASAAAAGSRRSSRPGPTTLLATAPRSTFNQPGRPFPRPALGTLNPPPAQPLDPAHERVARDATAREEKSREAKMQREEQELELQALETAYKDRARSIASQEKMAADMRAKVAQDSSDQRERAVARAVAAARDKARKMSVSGGNAWSNMVDTATAARGKYYETPRSLLLMLEEERTKSLQLETDHGALLAELEATKRAYESKIKDITLAREADVRSMQRSLLEKADECNALAKKLSSATSKHADDVLVWSGRAERLDGQAAKLQATLSTAEERVSRQEKALLDLHAVRKSLLEKVSHREREMKKLMSTLKAKDTDWLSEKEQRMKLEVKVLELEHAVASRDDQITSTQALLARARSEADELAPFKPQAQSLLREVAECESREKILNAELDKAHAHARRSASDLDSETLAHRKVLHELELSRQREASRAAELDETREREIKARAEVDVLLDRQSAMMQDASAASARERKLSSDVDDLSRALASNKAKRNDLEKKLEVMSIRVVTLEAAEEKWGREKQALLKENRQVHNAFEAKERDLQDVERLLQETELLLDSERRAVVELKAAAKDRIMELADRATALVRLEEQVAQLKGNLTAARRATDDAQQAAESERERWVRNSEHLQARIEVLEDALVNAETRAQKLAATEETLRETVANAEQETHALHARIDGMHDDIGTEQASRAEDRERAAAEAKRVKEAYEHAMVEQANRISDLEHAVTQRDARMMALAAQIETARKERDDFQRRADTYENDARSLRNELEGTQATLVTRDADLSVQRLQLEASAKAVRRLDDEVRRLRAFANVGGTYLTSDSAAGAGSYAGGSGRARSTLSQSTHSSPMRVAPPPVRDDPMQSRLSTSTSRWEQPTSSAGQTSPSVRNTGALRAPVGPSVAQQHEQRRNAASAAVRQAFEELGSTMMLPDSQDPQDTAAGGMGAQQTTIMTGFDELVSTEQVGFSPHLQPSSSPATNHRRPAYSQYAAQQRSASPPRPPRTEYVFATAKPKAPTASSTSDRTLGGSSGSSGGQHRDAKPPNAMQ